ncbi:MAG: carboxypeptidase-like regulatory domain-containing protein, partial [Crocinitomicaceae bacterium]|nr:carboxypeptidase-like regulatory domain-containing protein [Crocinitomicaceae bacterium]
MKILKNALIFLFALAPLMGMAQEADTIYLDSNLIQLSGVVINEEDLETMPYTTVFDKTVRTGVIADYYGYFSTVVYPGDTLYFTYFGYKTSTFIVPDSLEDNRYSIIQMLQRDTLNLPEVVVYPWPSKEDFARAFVEMRPY